MKTTVYAIYDRAVRGYYTPFTYTTDAEARRVLANLVNDPKSIMSANPEDFRLDRLGTIDLEHGVMVPGDSVICVAEGTELVTKITTGRGEMTLAQARQMTIPTTDEDAADSPQGS